MNWHPTQPAIKQLLQAMRAEAGPVYLVGGAVRDLALSRESTIKDLDFVVDGPAIPIARRVADRLAWAFYPLDVGRDVARIIFLEDGRPALVCDIARMRGQSIDADLAARDFTINAMALGWGAQGASYLIDPHGGMADLHSRVLRRVSATSLAEDAIRVLRAPRFAAQLGLSIERETEAQAMRLARTLQLASGERIRDELWKALKGPHPVAALAETRRLGLLPHIFPELDATIGVTQSPPHTADVWNHTLHVVARAHRLAAWIEGRPDAAGPSADARAMEWDMLASWRYRLRQLFLEPVAADRTRIDWLLWHALLHDIGKPAARAEHPDTGYPPIGGGDDDSAAHTTRIRFFGHEDIGAELARARLEELRFSRQEITLCTRVIQNHMRLHHLNASFGDEPVGRRAAYRFFRAANFDEHQQMVGLDTVLVALCDYGAIHQRPEHPLGAGYARHAQELVAFAFEQIDQATKGHAPLVDGRALMRHFNLKPGRHVGEVLSRLHEAQVAGEICSVEEALSLAADHLRQRSESRP